MKAEKEPSSRYVLSFRETLGQIVPRISSNDASCVSLASSRSDCIILGEFTSRLTLRGAYRWSVIKVLVGDGTGLPVLAQFAFSAAGMFSVRLINLGESKKGLERGGGQSILIEFGLSVPG